MKRKILVITMLVAIALTAFSQTVTYNFPEVQPKDARTMGMGGAFHVFSQGYSSFFGNPAGFAGMSSLTLLDLSTWAYLAPTTTNVSRIQSLFSGASTTDIIGYASDWVTGNNGLGAGTSVGLGWVGKRGLSFGVNLVTDEVVAGSSLLTARLSSATQANGVLGLAYPFKLGPLSLKIGVDGRIFYRMQSNPVAGWGITSVITDFSNPGNISASSFAFIGGYGFAADAGLIFGIGPVMFGFSARDLGLEFKVGSFTAQDLANGDFGALISGGSVSALLIPSYAAGVGVRLFENGLFEPSVYAEVDDPITLVQSTDFVTDALKSLHAGAQLRLLKFITARAGLNKGWYSIGAGIDLSFIEFDAAMFTEETGMYPGERGRSGISIQAAIRFGR